MSRRVEAAEQHRKKHQPEAGQDYRLWPPLERLTKQKALGVYALDRIQSRCRPNRSATVITKGCERRDPFQTRGTDDLASISF